MGKQNYKFAVVNNTVVDKPHRVSLQKQKLEIGDGLLAAKCWILCVFVCVRLRGRVLLICNEGGRKERQMSEEAKRSSE